VVICTTSGLFAHGAKGGGEGGGIGLGEEQVSDFLLS